MHDIGFMVNCLVFSKEFAPVMERACREEIPLDEVEQATTGVHPLRHRARPGRKMGLGRRHH